MGAVKNTIGNEDGVQSARIGTSIRKEQLAGGVNVRMNPETEDSGKALGKLA